MQDIAPRIPIGLLEAVLNTTHAAGLMAGGDTHLPALHFVGEVVPYTQDPQWVREIVAGYLPAGYAGNTLKEIPGMVSDSLKKGYGTPKANKKPPSAAEIGLEIVRNVEMELFHTPQQIGFAALTRPDAGTICHPIRSEAMRGYIRLRYHLATGKTISRDALAEIIDLMDAEAIFMSPEEEVHVRVAGFGGDVYYDPGQPDGTIVKIAPTGWTLVREAPVRFYRPNGFGMQAIPERGGNLNDLRDLLQRDDKSWVLLLAFLLISLRPTHPYMVRRFDEVEPPTTVRMADAAQWLIAAEPATGLPEGTFLRALEASVREITIENTINHPLVLAIFKLLDALGPKRAYEGTVGELHDKLRDEFGRLDPQLPQTASHLSNTLQRLAHGMAEIGLRVELMQRTNRAKPVRIWIEPTEHTPEPGDMAQRLW